ncbi:UNVERIFIED_ORG: O-antigen/teichoic acid export membrane protein [Arthrobacter sp. UYEF2]
MALATVSVGFMVPGLVRTKFASLIFGAHGVAFIGQLSQIQTVLISLGAAGIVTATRVILARRTLSGDKLHAAQNWLILVPTGLAMAFAVIAALFSAPLSVLLLGSERYFPLLIAAAAGIPVAVFGQISLAIAQVRAKRSRLIAAAALSAVAGGGAVMALMLSGDEFLASSSFVAAPLAQVFVITCMCPESRLTFGRWPRLPADNGREVLSLAWSSALLGIFAAAAELAGRIVVVQRHGLEVLAAYQPVVLLVTQLVGMLLSAVATSSLIEIGGIRDRRELADRLNEVTSRLIPVIGGLLAMLSGLGQVLIVVFFSASLVPAALPLLTLGLAGELMRAYAWILGSSLLPQGMRGLWLINGLLTVTVQLAISCTAGYFFGPLGLVLGLIAGNAFSAILTLLLLLRCGITVRRRGLLSLIGITGGLVIIPLVMPFTINFVTLGFGLLLFATAKYAPHIRNMIGAKRLA